MFPLLASLTASAALSHGATLWPPMAMYPPAALEKSQQGTVAVRITKDANAAPACAVLSGSSSAWLDAAACSIILPRVGDLLEASAKALKIKVRWHIQAGQSSTTFGGAIPFDPPSWIGPSDIPSANYPRHGTGRTEIGFDVGRDGSVTACGITASSGTPELDQRLCDLISKRAAFLPAIDEKGSTHTAHASTAVTWFGSP